MTLRPPLHTLCAAALVALAGCNTSAQPAASVPAPGRSASATAEAEQRLQALLGDAACTEDAQCRTIGWGAKACGGPQRWVAYSTQRTDAVALEALAKAHAEQQRKEQQRLGIMSTCEYVAGPGARCVAQRCVLNTGASGRPLAQ